MKSLYCIFVLFFIISCRKDKDYNPVVYVYPIQVQNELNISISHNKKNDFDVSIFNTLGNQILNKNIENLNQTLVNFETFEKGMYFVKIEGVNVEEQIKIVKE